MIKRMIAIAVTAAALLAVFAALSVGDVAQADGEDYAALKNLITENRTIPIVKLLLALALVTFVHMALLPYFRDPETFFIERLRRGGERRVSHAHLLIRAFVGIGLVCSGVWALAFALALSVVLDVSVFTWLAITLGGFVIVGTREYIGFRLFKYQVKNLDKSSVPGRGLFTLRENKGEKARRLRIAFIIAFVGLIAVSLIQMLTPLVG